jgi:endonuclease YncB( thermonuclease family)
VLLAAAWHFVYAPDEPAGPAGSFSGEAMVRAGRTIELKSHSRGRYLQAEPEARDAARRLWAGRFERPSGW